MSHRTHKPPKFPVTSFSNEVTVAVVGCGVGVGVFSFACSEFGESDFGFLDVIHVRRWT